jgi:hypothetical protein
MKIRIVLGTAALLSTVACASIMHGSNQSVAFNSTPAGASISVDGTPMGVTPAVLRLERKSEHTVRLDLAGYAPFEMQLKKRLSGWVWGNIVFGGIIGVIVDGTTGAMYRLSPGEVDGALETRTAVIDGQQTIQIAIVMTADPSWEKIGQLTRE